MGRGNNHTSSSNNKGSLPQTPKNLKIDPNRVTEEFSNELADHGAAREGLNKKSK
ncbi:YfhD family protein [Peribacillus alkalitolerans]|uniref:YfhD family protein n=1 Tax=Peribacillus alkalitolerans TaxID=1550385 RepID=UPI0013D0132D|nr:YfhD family protein [Peribacillus alkalitolerans]